MRFKFLQRAEQDEFQLRFEDENEQRALFYQDEEAKAIYYNVPNMQNITVSYREWERPGRSCEVDKDAYSVKCGI